MENKCTFAHFFKAEDVKKLGYMILICITTQEEYAMHTYFTFCLLLNYSYEFYS